MNNEYFRKFITLAHENGQSGKSFGTVVVEQRSGVNKLTLSISNIRPNILYSITLVKVFEAHARFVDVFTFKSDNNGNASCKEEISMKTLQNIELSEFNVCIIKIQDTKELITPLVGYFNEKVKWREYYIPKEEPKVQVTAKEPKVQSTKNEPKIQVTTKELKKVEIESDTINIPTKPYEFGFNSKPVDYINPVNRNLKDNIEGLKHSVKHDEDHIHIHHEEVEENQVDLEAIDATPTPTNPNLPRKFKIKPPETKKSNIELITDIDDFEYRDNNVTYQNSDPNEVLEKIKVEIHNLKDLANDTHEYSTECSFESFEKLPYSLDGIFEKAQSISPFKNNNSEVDWVMIDYSDLLLIDTELQFVRNPFFRNAYKRFSHFIFGKCIEDSKTIYMLGVPDFFNHEFEQDIRDLGFISFRESTLGLQQGYWIIVL